MTGLLTIKSDVTQVENLWNPVRMVTPTGVVEHKLPKHNLPMNFLRGEGMIYEAQAVRDCLKKGKCDQCV